MAFPPFDVCAVAWVATAPALLTARLLKPGEAAFGGLLYGLAHGALLLHWLFGIFGVFGAALLLISSLSYIAIFAAVPLLCSRWGSHALVWGAPIVWIAMEFLRSECWSLKFAWFGFGYSQHANLAILQLASIGGVYGLSMLIAAANGSLAWFLARPSWRRIVPAFAVVVALHGIGYAMIRPAQGDFRVAGIEGEDERLPHFLAESERAMTSKPRLVVWPEYALGVRLSEGDRYTPRIAEFARRHGVHVLLGATRAVSQVEFENTLFLFGPDGRIVGTQVKSVPVQFFRDGRPAQDRAPLPLGIGAGVCYDMNYPYVSRELVIEGAELLVFPTMDARSWGNVQHVQHAAMTALRAVEHRRWILRVATSGVSCIVDPHGRRTDHAGTFVGDVGMSRDRTFYTWWGYWLPHACVIASMLLAGLTLRRKMFR